MTQKQAELLLALRLAGYVVYTAEDSAFTVAKDVNNLKTIVFCCHYNHQYWHALPSVYPPTYVAGIPEIIDFIESQRQT